VCAVCGRDCCGFVGVSVRFVRFTSLWVWGSECVLCVGEFDVCFWE